MSLIDEFKFAFRKKIVSLHSSHVKDMLIDDLKSGKIENIKTLMEQVVRNPSTPYSNEIRLARDIKKCIEIWRIGKKWEEAKKHGKVD